ncbi:FAD-dependent oxidoreductase [Sinorhizobium sp. 7-81]|uniref:flavin monoamine oxidase family protein n=1 Tax=Sinorhizobium sp. 8-89 TaxID=3049089 RepID=UPI0024C26B5E|nr:FAD-dependent oxidoreductase [Sinorhizobium sp. 8-89]MDK1493029.1 FAD-dependent oxidoreductase [Sinorhizobium sp. 8-89]
MLQSILIVGGGLAGLTAARLLYRAGIGFKLLEARQRLGGRILSVDATGEPSGDGFDLGPSWFWPGMQPAMGDLVDHLGLHSFEQNSEGDVIFQRMSQEHPQRYRGMRQEPRSMRLVGGTGAIISQLAEGLPVGSIELGAQVTHVSLDGESVVVQYLDASGLAERVRASHVLFALPPRLLEAKVLFSPALDFATLERWRRTPTWMAPHAKFFALYDRPFWRDAGLSGTAQSMVGPLVEIHDATTASSRAALFGFVGVPAAERAAAGRDAIVAASVQQLARMFGPEAASPRATLFKDWADDPLTATADDRQAGGHPTPDPRPWVNGKWRDYISLAGSETSISEPGYLAGAVEAASRITNELITRLSQSEPHDLTTLSEAFRA